MASNTSARFVMVAPMSRDFLDRLVRIAHAKGSTLGGVVYGTLSELCPGLPEHPNIRTKVDTAALVAGYVVRVWPTRDAFTILDAWLYCLPGDPKLADRIKSALLKKYGRVASDDRQLNLNFGSE